MDTVARTVVMNDGLYLYFDILTLPHIQYLIKYFAL